MGSRRIPVRELNGREDVQRLIELQHGQQIHPWMAQVLGDEYRSVPVPISPCAPNGELNSNHRERLRQSFLSARLLEVVLVLLLDLSASAAILAPSPKIWREVYLLSL